MRARQATQLGGVMEQLEKRALLSTINWISSAAGSFADPSKWAGGVVPGPTDTAVIGTPGILVIVDSPVFVGAIQSKARFDISAALQVNVGASSIAGVTAEPTASLVAQGAGTSFVSTGSTSVDGASVSAQGGASLALPMLTSTTTSGTESFHADGGGSMLSLSSLTSINDPDSSTVEVHATNGGQINLSHLAALAGTYLNASADGTGSVVDLSKLATIDNSSGSSVDLSATNLGQVKMPLLTSLDHVNLTLDASGVVPTSQLTSLTNGALSVAQSANFNSLTDIDGSTIDVSGGATLSLPNVSSYAANSSTLSANGAGSVLDLSGLISLSSPNIWSYVRAAGGGRVDLGNLPVLIGSYLDVSSDGSGSEIDLFKLASISNGSSGPSVNFTATNGGAVQIPRMTSLDRVNLRLDATGAIPMNQLTAITNGSLSTAQSLDMPALGDIDGSSLAVSGPATLALAGIVTYADTNGSNWVVSNGGTLQIPSLTSISEAAGQIFLVESAGGTADLRNLHQITGAQLQAQGAGSVISAVTLGDLNAVTVFATAGANIFLGSGDTTVAMSTVEVEAGATIHAGTIIATNGSTIEGGGTIAGNLFISSGTCLPGPVGTGAAIGTLTIAGNYVQAPCGMLWINFAAGGTAPQCDQLQVSGLAALSGTLQVNLFDSAPSLGSQFNVLAATSQLGFFTSLQGVMVNAGEVLDPVYNASGPMAGMMLLSEPPQNTPPVVTTIGDGTSQRSEIRQLTIKFPSAVTLTAGALALYLSNDGGSGSSTAVPNAICLPPTNATVALGTPTSADDGITWVIPILPNTAFSDQTASLTDGIYCFDVHGPAVLAGTTPIANSDFDVQFHRLFGDISGSKTVNNADYLALRQSYLSSTGSASFNSNLDYDGNGVINNADFLQLRKRYLKMFSY